MRKSLEDIMHMVSKKPYHKVMPKELEPYHYFLLDSGHCIMCVLERHLDEAKETCMDDYEIPIPIKYVLEKGYRIINGYIIVDADYDDSFGLNVDVKYYEF